MMSTMKRAFRNILARNKLSRPWKTIVRKEPLSPPPISTTHPSPSLSVESKPHRTCDLSLTSRRLRTAHKPSKRHKGATIDGKTERPCRHEERTRESSSSRHQNRLATSSLLTHRIRFASPSRASTSPPRLTTQSHQR
jgi:hypothetical protein